MPKILMTEFQQRVVPSTLLT